MGRGARSWTSDAQRAADNHQGDGDMDRRTFVGLTAATAASSLLSRTAFAQTTSKAKNVVLVHGLFADGSSWSEVIPRLQAAGLNVTSVQNPLTTLSSRT